MWLITNMRTHEYMTANTAVELWAHAYKEFWSDYRINYVDESK